ncbi:SDR family NAD(P)-dependent oxidoreductase [Actinophytocola xanthii]|uniref:NAD-dependent epimerase n=1 Tax=Actinophytocola xanthii TaxID=1912961 RepID=A0A1Q8C7K7_9PSEU|nr:SDR family NAD(P)-dependent oxidoreductase [Actinophytocola xanthii]OLF10330.1 NAD-dependent epimerase [Actinophytocola xanthii]
MLVCVTGGTGFVGAHTVAAVLAAGHRVRLLVREGSAVDSPLAAVGVPPGAVEVVAGDVLDEAAVARAVRGADAVLHAAAVYSFDPRDRARVRATNRRGTEVVLEAAWRAGTGRAVHVSSVAALYPAAGPVDENSPVGRAREPYSASKAAAERVARHHQKRGAPVAITYPPALLGPHDPRLGDQTRRLRDTLRGLMPVWPDGGFPLGDVRDTAALHAEVLTGSGAGRHFGPGRYLTTREQLRTLREVTGRALPAVHLPARALLPVGLLAGLAQRVWPWHLPVEHGAIHTCATATPVAASAARGRVPARPVAETVADTVAWLHEAGHISARAAGRAVTREVRIG